MTTGWTGTPFAGQGAQRGQVAAQRVEVDLQPGRARERRQAGRRKTRLDRAHVRLTGSVPCGVAGLAVGRQALARTESEALGTLPPLGHAGQAFPGDREALGQVRREQAGVAVAVAHPVAGRAVQVDPQPRGGERREALGQQRTDRAGEDVARPAGGQGRVLERRDRDLAVRGGDHGPGTLEHDDLLPGGRRITHGRDPGLVVVGEVAVRAVLDAAARTQALELPDVRGEDRRPTFAAPPAVHRRQRPEGLGVEHDRGRLLARAAR